MVIVTSHHPPIDRTFRQRGCGYVWLVYLLGQPRRRIGDDYRLSDLINLKVRSENIQVGLCQFLKTELPK